MGCDYYIVKYLLVEYKDDEGEIIEERLDEERERCYYPEHIYPSDYDSDEDDDTRYEKLNKFWKSYVEQFKRPNKVLFENGQWIKEGYRKNYEKELEDEYGIKDLIRLVKVHDAYER